VKQTRRKRAVMMMIGMMTEVMMMIMMMMMMMMTDDNDDYDDDDKERNVSVLTSGSPQTESVKQTRRKRVLVHSDSVIICNTRSHGVSG
jgi:hypothetical protein